MGVITQIEGHAALVILDWPEKRNALGPRRPASSPPRCGPRPRIPACAAW